MRWRFAVAARVAPASSSSAELAAAIGRERARRLAEGDDALGLGAVLGAVLLAVLLAVALAAAATIIAAAPVTVAAAVVLSLFVALTLTPMLVLKMPLPEPPLTSTSLLVTLPRLEV